MQSAKRKAQSLKPNPSNASSTHTVPTPPCGDVSRTLGAKRLALSLLLLTCSLLPTLAIAQKTDWPIVLPAFTNESGDEEHDWLSVGLPETFRTKLHGTIYMRALTFEEIGQVVSEDPSLADEFIEISKQLGSDLLVQGSYRVIGDTIELTAQCIDPVSGRPLSTFKSLGPSFDPGRTVNDIITQIAQALRIAIPDDQAESIRRPTTMVADAFREHALGLVALTGDEDGGPDAIADAKKHFQEAISLDPKYADPHYRLGTLLQHQKDLAGAEASYRAALRADIDHRDARYRLGLLLIDQNRKSEAMTELEQALKQAPEDPRMQAALSSIWFDQYQANFNQMADGIRQAIAAEPENADLYVQLGDVYKELSKVPEAMGQYRLALEKNSKHAEAAYKLAMIERSMNRTAEAAKRLRQAIANGTSEKRAHFYLGEMLLRQNDHAGAADAFQKATEAEPNHTPAYMALGDALAKVGRNQDALLAYNQYAQMNREDATPYIKIGEQYQTMGLAKQAMTAYKKSIEIDPKFADGHIAIGHLYETENLTFRAAKSFKEALLVQPDHPRAEELKALIRKYQPAPTGNKR